MDFNKLCINCMKEKPQVEGVCPFCGFDESQYERLVYTLAPGTVLHGKYLVGAVIDQGGFGIMYKAFDMKLEHMVAVKEYYVRDVMTRNTSKTDFITISYSDDSQKKLYEINREKFEKEAKTLASLSDLPGIVRVLDFFNEWGTSYIVMEYLPGDTLREYVKKRGRLTSSLIREKLLPVMISLEYVHKRGILHRDISPDNMKFLDPDLSGGNLKLYDFGGAKVLQREPDDHKSIMVLKKKGYSPIEQIAGTANQGSWTDVYALAATIYYCLCGTAPADSNERAADSTCFRTPRELGVQISESVEQIILAGMALQPEDRIQSVEQFREALEEAGWGEDPEESSAAPLKEDISEPSAADDSSGSKPDSDSRLSRKSQRRENSRGYASEVNIGQKQISKEKRRKKELLIGFILTALLGTLFLIQAIVLEESRTGQRQTYTESEELVKTSRKTQAGGHLKKAEDSTSDKNQNGKIRIGMPDTQGGRIMLVLSVLCYAFCAFFLFLYFRVPQDTKAVESGGTSGVRKKDREESEYPGRRNRSKTNKPSGTGQPSKKKRNTNAEIRRLREEELRRKKMEDSRRKKALNPQLIHLNRKNDLIIAALPLTDSGVIIGTSQNNVSYLIIGNKRVSRRHAMVTFEQGRYYLTDLKSTNGTYLNGSRLIPSMKYPINPGDRIALFNERFVFVVSTGQAKIIPGMTYRWN